MWLLIAETRKLESIIGDCQNVGPYAILSHTWGREEVLFQDVSRNDVHEMEGYQKLDYACRQAIKDDLQYVWIDTCCIDQRSSAELSEAINSMYRWYYHAYVCYTYLADVRAEGTGVFGFHDVSVFTRLKEQISRSRYFTRGWTLQETIAPRRVEFYDVEWNPLGMKSDVVETLSHITRISREVLRNRDLLSSASIAQKMAWAAGRQTTRPEDQAYALLGLFDVQLPLLYGEGTKAFMRLQEEIIRSLDADSRDHSIFAWSSHSGDLLAPSSSCFYDAGEIISWTSAGDETYELTKKGLRVTLLVRPIDHYTSEVDHYQSITAVLNCRYSGMQRSQIAYNLRRRPRIGLRNQENFTEGDHIYDKLPMMCTVSASELEHFVKMDLTIARKPFVWPQTRSQVYISVQAAHVQETWPTTAKFVRDRCETAPDQCGGIMNLGTTDIEDFANFLLSDHADDAFHDLRVWKVLGAFGVRVERKSTPPKLFVTGSYVEDLETLWTNETAISVPALEVGEKRNINCQGLESFSATVEYVLENGQLMWHLKLKRLHERGGFPSLPVRIESTRNEVVTGTKSIPDAVRVQHPVMDLAEKPEMGNESYEHFNEIDHLWHVIAELRSKQLHILADRSLLERGVRQVELGLGWTIKRILEPCRSLMRLLQKTPDHPCMPELQGERLAELEEPTTICELGSGVRDSDITSVGDMVDNLDVELKLHGSTVVTVEDQSSERHDVHLPAGRGVDRERSSVSNVTQASTTARRERLQQPLEVQQFDERNVAVASIESSKPNASLVRACAAVQEAGDEKEYAMVVETAKTGGTTSEELQDRWIMYGHRSSVTETFFSQTEMGLPDYTSAS